jgi:hypothetical protein
MSDAFFLNLFARGATLVNETFLVPNGTTQNGDPRILCVPITPIKMAAFFAGNFVAHIVTVKSTPGETAPITIVNSVLALLLPTSGLMRGLNAIARRVQFGISELDKACRAGALCVVVRDSSWKPKAKQTLPSRQTDR